MDPKKIEFRALQMIEREWRDYVMAGHTNPGHVDEVLQTNDGDPEAAASVIVGEFVAWFTYCLERGFGTYEGATEAYFSAYNELES